MPAQGVVSGTALVFVESSRWLALQKESKVDEWRLAGDHVYMLLSIPPKYDDNPRRTAIGSPESRRNPNVSLQLFSLVQVF
jgi:REP element-mobilizing transposase RayT